MELGDQEENAKIELRAGSSLGETEPETVGIKVGCTDSIFNQDISNVSSFTLKYLLPTCLSILSAFLWPEILYFFMFSIQFAQSMAHSAEDFVRQVWLRGWQLLQFAQLPNWMKDNNFIIRGHRPALKSYWGCAKSIFRVHTETGNIWTHLLGKCRLK